MTQLTAQQIQELKQGGWPFSIHNPETGEKFYLMGQEMFDRAMNLLHHEDEIREVEEMYPLVVEATANGEANSRESA
jgi:hypothetical protein